MKSPQLCSHARTNGQMCKAIALTGKKFCYYHQRDRDRQARINRNLDHRRSLIANERTNEIIALLPDGKSSFDDNSAELFQNLQLPNFEDADAIQVSLSTLFRAIATQQVSPRAAGLMLYTLQIATCNLKKLDTPERDFHRHATLDDSPITPYTTNAESPIRNLAKKSASESSEENLLAENNARPADIIVESESVPGNPASVPGIVSVRSFAKAGGQ